MRAPLSGSPLGRVLAGGRGRDALRAAASGCCAAWFGGRSEVSARAMLRAWFLVFVGARPCVPRRCWGLTCRGSLSWTSTSRPPTAAR
eukprot:275153-Alexandrium_andersonii.AAC.1